MNNFWTTVIVVIVLLYVIKKRNAFEKLRRSVKHASSDIGIYIDKRSSCLNDAMRIAKVSYSHEVAGIEKLTAKDQLDQLAFLGEKYPTLQSIGGYSTIISDAMALNADIAASRGLVNGNIQEYNDAITAFPGLIVAFIFGYKKEKFIDEDNIESNKRLEKTDVDFSAF